MDYVIWMWIILNMDGRFVSFGKQHGWPKIPGFSFAMIEDHLGYRGYIHCHIYLGFYPLNNKHDIAINGLTMLMNNIDKTI